MLAEFPSGLTFVIAGTTVNEVGLAGHHPRTQGDRLSGRAAPTRRSSQPEKIFADEMDVEEFNDPAPYGQIENLHKNFYNCIRHGGTPFCNVDLSVRANTVLALAEMSERLGIMAFFDEKTRTIKNGEGKVIPPLSYDTVVPKLLNP